MGKSYRVFEYSLMSDRVLKYAAHCPLRNAYAIFTYDSHCLATAMSRMSVGTSHRLATLYTATHEMSRFYDLDPITKDL